MEGIFSFADKYFRNWLILEIESSDESELDPGEYEVDQIVSRRILKDRPKIKGRPKDVHYEYEVAWLGYPLKEDNSWKSYDELKISCSD